MKHQRSYFLDVAAEEFCPPPMTAIGQSGQDLCLQILTGCACVIEPGLYKLIRAVYQRKARLE